MIKNSKFNYLPVIPVNNTRKIQIAMFNPNNTVISAFSMIGRRLYRNHKKTIHIIIFIIFVSYLNY